MSSFKKRTTAPSTTNKYYLKAGKGGYNRAIEINSKTHSCLPNCCGNVHARWLESRGLTNYSKYDKLSTGDAQNYYKYTKDGYKRGKTPKLGAVAVWKSKTSGHVAFVETFNSTTLDFVGSNSAWKGSRWYLKTYYKKDNYGFQGKTEYFTFLGFIYLPEDTSDEKTEKIMEELKAQMTELENQITELKAKIVSLNADLTAEKTYKYSYVATKDATYKIKLNKDEKLIIK